MVPIEGRCRSGDGTRANWVFDSSLPSFGGAEFNEFVLEIMPCRWLVIEFGQGHLICVPFQSLSKLVEGGVGDGGVGASHGVRAAAGAVEVGCQFLGAWCGRKWSL